MPSPNEKIISEKDEIWFDENQIARIRIFEEVELEEKDMERQFESYEKLGINENNLKPVVVDASLGFTINKEARELTAKRTKFYFNAAAVVSNSLSTRLIINFLNSFYNFGLPIKLFRTEKEALKWIAKYK